MTLSRELLRQGHEVEVAVKSGGDLERIYKEGGLQVAEVPLDSFFTGARLRRYVRERQFDILHAHLTGAARLAVKVAKDLPVGLVAHAHILKDDSIFQEAAKTGCLITVSRYVSEYYLNECHVPAERLHMVHNGTDAMRHGAASTSKSSLRREVTSELGLPANARLVTLAGRVSPGKGQEVLVKAAPMILQKAPETRFLIFGNMEQKHGYVAKVESLIEELGLKDRVLMLGFRTDAPRLVRAAHAHVVPSLEEPFGLVVIEGMMLETPIVASRVGGIPEIIDDGDLGTLVEPGDAVALAQGVIEALLRPDQQRIRRARKAAQERFAPDVMTGRILEIYKEARRLRGLNEEFEPQPK